MKKELFVFTVIIFLTLLFEFVGFLTPLRTFSHKFVVPATVWSAKLITKVFEPYDMLVFSFTKLKYMKQLESNYARALSQLNQLDQLQAENEELRKLLGASERETNKKTIVGVPIVSLAFPAVGAGKLDGVQEKDMVLVSDVLVGTIEQVTEYQSKVSLLSSKRKNRILAKTESGVEGVIDGDGRNVLLTHIPRSTEVKEGERVMTVGQEGIEKNVLIGTIQKITNNPSDATQTFVVSQLVSFYSAVLVEVQ